MATINFMLDDRHIRPDGKCPLSLLIRAYGYRRRLPLNLDIEKKYWDDGRLSTKHPMYKRLSVTLDYIMQTAELALVETRGKTIDEVVNAIGAAINIEPPKRRGRTLIDVLKHIAETKLKSTRLTFERTINHVRKFDEYAELDKIGRDWLTRFDLAMTETCPSPNSRAIHMRNIRTAFNYAIDEGWTSCYPFRKFKIKTVKTAKRSLLVEDLRRLFSAEVEEWQRPYLRFFMLSFCMIGTNPVDLMHLTPSNLRNGRIEFNRAKTSRLYSIKVEPEAEALIEEMRGNDYLLNILDTRTDYLQYIRQCNHALKRIGTKSVKGRKPTGDALFPEITLYWARHSWATIAASLDIPKETIAKALGHGTETVTDIYIDFDRKKVDEANRRVLSWVFYGDEALK